MSASGLDPYADANQPVLGPQECILFIFRLLIKLYNKSPTSVSEEKRGEIVIYI